MDSDLEQQQYSHHFQSKQQQMNTGGGGLTRYRSAPSSYFSSFMDNGDFSQAPPPRPLSPETESILARFMENVADGPSGSTPPPPPPHKLYDIPENLPVMQPQFVKQETEQNSNLSSSSQMNYQSNINSIETSFRLPGTSSNLTRHRSSPAGLFDDIIIENGFLVNKETPTSTNNQINFSSGNSFMDGFQGTSWDDSSIFSGTESRGDDFNSPENQNREGRNRAAAAGGLLSHHLSLPKSSIEKLLQFQESVPCKLRAKRGFATHPRSIAERVRRTKISERMRKLQDLVPNMDKQTNTSDMLDLAVDYIKELQKQVQTLTDKRDKCSCTS